MDIKEARKRVGISQAELARRVGLHQSGVSRIERGTRALSVARLRRFAAALGLSPAALLDGDQERAA